MSSTPDHEFTGIIARFTLERRSGGGAALIAFTDADTAAGDADSGGGYVRLEFSPAALADLADRAGALLEAEEPTEESHEAADETVSRMVNLMKERGGAQEVSLNDATDITGRSRATAARRLKTARTIYTQTG